MKQDWHTRTAYLGLGVATFLLAVTLAGCSPTAPTETQTATATAESSNTPAPAGSWSELLQRTPYPFTIPLPPPIKTVVDGTYVKFDPRPGERAGCKRCPPYPPEGGTWKLNLDAGIFRVYHERTGWRSLGSFTVSDDRIAFFNDPHCIHDVGTYSWKLQSGQLNLQLIEDTCGPELRAKNFASQPWTSCQPSSTEAATTDHWPIPPGCSPDSVSPKE